jgi:Glyoxalase/Bleomycin resistance protein/Dioxygenase superfamily
VLPWNGHTHGHAASWRGASKGGLTRPRVMRIHHTRGARSRYVAAAPAEAPERKGSHPMVKPIPDGYRTVTPYLTVKSAAQAIDFYTRAFGAQEVERMTGPDGQSVMHAEVKVGDSVVMPSDEFPQMGCRSPQTLGGTTASLFLYVPDVDAAFKRTRNCAMRPDTSSRLLVVLKHPGHQMVVRGRPESTHWASQPRGPSNRHATRSGLGRPSAGKGTWTRPRPSEGRRGARRSVLEPVARRRTGEGGAGYPVVAPSPLRHP